MSGQEYQYSNGGSYYAESSGSASSGSSTPRKELVRTPQPRGGRASGGPAYNAEGYYKVERRNVTVHNNGGKLFDPRPADPGYTYGGN